MSRENSSIPGRTLSVARGVGIGALRRFVDHFHINGFNEAAEICMDVLSKNIDDLNNKIKSGTQLSDREQFLLVSLNDIRSETEKRLRDPWDGLATDEGRS